MKKSNQYIRYLELAREIKNDPKLPILTPLEERILNVIAIYNFRDERISVRDLMMKSELGSSAMLYLKLKSMIEKGWIVLADTEDKRRKQLKPTKAAEQYFGKLSKSIQKIATRH